jgi:type I site-specific restriction-modification system R (restriction) subunit
MERIILEVDDQTAKAWRNTSARLREQIGKNLEQVLNDSLNKSKEVNFEMLLKEIRIEAAKNGLTEEILAQLLNEQD